MYIRNKRKEVNMEYDIKWQIEAWTKKMRYYEQEEHRLREKMKKTEAMRKEVDLMPVGDPKIEKFYRKLSGYYTQYATLPAKIRKCKDNIETLKVEALWN